jgi:hypothetical protein
MTLRQTTFRKKNSQHYSKKGNAQCNVNEMVAHNLAIILSVVLLNAFILCVIMPSDNMLSVVTLSVIMLSVVTLLCCVLC